MGWTLAGGVFFFPLFLFSPFSSSSSSSLSAPTPVSLNQDSSRPALLLIYTTATTTTTTLSLLEFIMREVISLHVGQVCDSLHATHANHANHATHPLHALNNKDTSQRIIFVVAGTSLCPFFFTSTLTHPCLFLLSTLIGRCPDW
ncbi:MAG: hypothetical protein JOS17DRAFT_119203 [Linnemannia elongata]|nr:MAG: hypothetical protein JOS17DRAFT_119203 [Linnemannia elongata]